MDQWVLVTHQLIRGWGAKSRRAFAANGARVFVFRSLVRLRPGCLVSAIASQPYGGGRNRLELSSQKRGQSPTPMLCETVLMRSCVRRQRGWCSSPSQAMALAPRDGHIVARRLGAPRSQSSQVGFWVLCSRCSRPLGVLARFRVIRAISSRPFSQGLPEYVEHGDQENSYASGSEHSDKDGRAHTPPRGFRSAACPHQWH